MPIAADASAPRPRVWLAALGVVLLFLAVALGLGAMHRLLLINSPVAGAQVESDFYYYYVRDAQRIADLRPPLDEFRGPLYPLVLALLGAVAPFASAFTLGKGVAAVSGAAAVWAVYLIGVETVGAPFGLAAAAAAAVTSPFLLHGMLVGTDAFFAGLQLVAVWLLMRALTTGPRDAALAGILSGLALSARWNAAFLPIAAVASFALARTLPYARRRTLIVAFAVAFGVTAAPWLVLNARLHGGHPFFNVYVQDTLGLYGGDQVFTSLGALVRASPVRFVARWAGYVTWNALAVAAVAPPFAVLALPGLGLLLAWGWRRPQCWTLVIALAGLFALNALGPAVVRQYMGGLGLLLVAAAATFHWAADAARGARWARPVLVIAWSVALGWTLAIATRDVRAVLDEEARVRPMLATTAPKAPLPIAGDWDDDGKDEVGIARDGPSGKVFYGFADGPRGPARWIAVFGPIGTPLTGRWERGAEDGIGVVNGGTFYLKNAFVSGIVGAPRRFGDMNDIPLAGDWDGDRVDTVGAFRDGVFSLTDRTTPPFTARALTLGGPGDLPVTGDWDGDGRDTIGIYRNGIFTLTNKSTPPLDDLWQVAAPVSAGVPLSGDWDGDGRDTLAVFTPDGTCHFLGGTPATRTIPLALEAISDLPTAGE